jgi:hypothetical protein
MGLPAPSHDDLVAIGRAEMLRLRPDLAVLDGDVTEAMLYASAAMDDAIIGWLVVQIRNLFFGGATGEDLDTIIMDRLRLARDPATRAVGSVTIYRSSGSGSSGTIVSGTQIGTVIAQDGSRTVVTTDADVSASAGAFSVNVNVTAVDYGTSGNAQAGTLATFVTPVLGGDTTINVTNSEDVAGGNESQSDEDYVQAAISLILTQVRGTLAAIERGALTVPSVAVAVATENPDTGICQVAVSDQDGNSNGLMLHLVAVALEDWRAAGSLVEEVGGIRADLALTISIDEYEPGFDVAAAAQTIQDSVATRVNRLRVGQELTFDSLKAAVIQPYGTSITKVSFPSVAVTIRGLSTPIYGRDTIFVGTSLIRLGAAPTIVDGKA